MASEQEQAQTPVAPPAAEAQEVSAFHELVHRTFKPKTPEAGEAIKSAVAELAKWASRTTKLIPADSAKFIKSVVEEIDRKLTEQINLILHHPDFQRLEGTWRGLYHLVSKTEQDEMLKIRVFNVSKRDLTKTIQDYPDASWDQSPLFKKIYRDAIGTPGAEPYGCLIGDYSFDHTPPDVATLAGMAHIAAAAHAPFLSAADPALMNMDSWQQIPDPAALARIWRTDDYAPWKSLRESEDARYLGLTLPRFLARYPYDPKTNPVDEFTFKEDTGAATHSRYVWANAAYAMGVNINKAFKDHGWCARIRGHDSGGKVEGLPVHTFKIADGSVDMKCPTETAIDERREKEFANLGLIPLSHYKGTDYAVFFGAQSLQKPQEYTDPKATANAKLSANLPYLFASCRFAHFLKAMVRDRIGGYMEHADMQRWLNNWIQQYVAINPEGEETKAKKPLAWAQAEVTEVEGDPGYYRAVFRLRPHFQLEGLDVSLRLVALPNEKK